MVPSRFRSDSQDTSRHADRNDIALLKLDRDVEGIPVAALFEGRATPGVRVCLAGFGCFATGLQNREKRWKDDGLKRAGENILDRDGNGLIAFDFDNGQPERNTLKNNRLLDKSLSKILGPGTSEARPLPLEGWCYSGDSGGPIYARENGQWPVLGATVSAPTIHCEVAEPQHSTEMSTAQRAFPITSTGFAARLPAGPDEAAAPPLILLGLVFGLVFGLVSAFLGKRIDRLNFTRFAGLSGLRAEDELVVLGQVDRGKPAEGFSQHVLRSTQVLPQ